jgi:hypothetical protein
MIQWRQANQRVLVGLLALLHPPLGLHGPRARPFGPQLQDRDERRSVVPPSVPMRRVGMVCAWALCGRMDHPSSTGAAASFRVPARPGQGAAAALAYRTTSTLPTSERGAATLPRQGSAVAAVSSSAASQRSIRG